jgi:hypothetical protein
MQNNDQQKATRSAPLASLNFRHRKLRFNESAANAPKTRIDRQGENR